MIVNKMMKEDIKYKCHVHILHESTMIIIKTRPE